MLTCWQVVTLIVCWWVSADLLTGCNTNWCVDGSVLTCWQVATPIVCWWVSADLLTGCNTNWCVDGSVLTCWQVVVTPIGVLMGQCWPVDRLQHQLVCWWVSVDLLTGCNTNWCVDGSVLTCWQVVVTPIGVLMGQCSTRPPSWPSGKASAPRAEDPGFESRLCRDFFGVESYQWLKSWHSSAYPAGRLAL